MLSIHNHTVSFQENKGKTNIFCFVYRYLFAHYSELIDCITMNGKSSNICLCKNRSAKIFQGKRKRCLNSFCANNNFVAQPAVIMNMLFSVLTQIILIIFNIFCFSMIDIFHISAAEKLMCDKQLFFWIVTDY